MLAYYLYLWWCQVLLFYLHFPPNKLTFKQEHMAKLKFPSFSIDLLSVNIPNSYWHLAFLGRDFSIIHHTYSAATGEL